MKARFFVSSIGSRIMTGPAVKLPFIGFLLFATCGATLVPIVGNYGEWRRLTVEEKTGYVMGAFDQQQSFSLMPSSSAELPFVIGIQQCSARNGLSAELLVQLVDRYYSQHQSSWKSPASEVLASALFDLCKDEINSAFKKAGLQTIPEMPKTSD